MPLVSINLRVIYTLALARLVSELEAPDFRVLHDLEDDPAGVAFVRLHLVQTMPRQGRPDDPDLRPAMLRAGVHVPIETLETQPYALQDRAHAVLVTLDGQRMTAGDHALHIDSGVVDPPAADGEAQAVRSTFVNWSGRASRVAGSA